MTGSDVMHIVVESLPSKDPSFYDFLSASLTPLIAIIGIYIAWQQYRVNQQRLRHDTYDRKIEVYRAVKRYFADIVRSGKSSYERAKEFYDETSEATFLFSDDINEKIDEIYDKSIDMIQLHEQMYPSDESPGLPVGDERSEVAKRNSELLKWHLSQIKIIKELFKKELGIK